MSDVTAKVSLSSPIIHSHPNDGGVQFAQLGNMTVMAKAGQLYVLNGGKWQLIEGNDLPDKKKQTPGW